MRPEVKIIFDKCEDLYRQCVRIRDDLTCQITGMSYPVELLEVMHYVGRTNKRVRWHPDNGCLGYKFLHRKTPEAELRIWYEKKFPDRAENINSIKNEKFRVNEKSLEGVYQRLRTWKAELEGCVTEIK